MIKCLLNKLYSISSDLTKYEIIEIDKRVARNREAAYLFIRKLPSNSKRKAKRLVIIFMFSISQPLAPCAAVIMRLAPAINRLSPIEESRIKTNKNYPQIAAIPASKVDKIKLTNEQIKQFDSLTQQLRGGDGLTDIVVVIAFIIFINWYDSLFGVEAFNPIITS